MNTKTSEVLKIFEKITEAISCLNDADYEKLLDDSFRLEINIRKRVDRAILHESKSTVNAALVLESLAGFSSREEARLYLDNTLPSKKDLEFVARELDISVLKSDKVKSLREKIVEATVGARIRSNAIQGKV
jgi:hypothetical protein